MSQKSIKSFFSRVSKKITSVNEKIIDIDESLTEKNPSVGGKRKRKVENSSISSKLVSSEKERLLKPIEKRKKLTGSFSRLKNISDSDTSEDERGNEKFIEKRKKSSNFSRLKNISDSDTSEDERGNEKFIEKRKKSSNFSRLKNVLDSDTSEDEKGNEMNINIFKEKKNSEKNNEVEKNFSTELHTKKSPLNNVLREFKLTQKLKESVYNSEVVKKSSIQNNRDEKKGTNINNKLADDTMYKNNEISNKIQGVDKKIKKNDKYTYENISLSTKITVDKQQNLDENPFYNPSSTSYHPVQDAFWEEGQKVLYLALAKTFELIEKTSARLKIIEILSNYFRSVIVLSPNDLLASVYLCLNQLAPAYEGLELGIAETNLMKAIACSTGRTLGQLKSEMQKVGDLGIVAEGSRSNQKTMFQPAPLTINTVFTKLREIAATTGSSSGMKKVDKIQSLFVACRFTEARYLIRSLAGKLRIGLAEQSVLQALALACTMTPPEQKRPFQILNTSTEQSSETFKQNFDEIALILKTTYCQCPNYDIIIPAILKKGIKGLPYECKLTPGIPLKPMLAHPTKGVQEVLSRFEGLKFTCEFKYDGERAQIHIKDDGSVKIYSRNQEDNTTKYPDIISRVSNTKSHNVKSCVLDCEAVAWDKEKKQILPFQVLSTRKRKDANEAEIKVQVCVFMFDLLYLNGVSLIKDSLKKRRELLKKHFKEVEGEWHFAKNMDAQTMEEVQEFLEESIKGNCEGLMIKTLEKEASYEIAKRSRNWLKLKKDYLDGIGDTLDLIVIGGYTGKGKRTGIYGGFLLACYDPESEEYQSICKIGTGFSEEDLEKHTEALQEYVVKQQKTYYHCDSSLKPDDWFEPKMVWEVKCADLSLSPVYVAAKGIVDSEKGISLRFPRFVRVRDDKNSEDATSSQQIALIYLSQEQIKNQTTISMKTSNEDFY